MVLSTEEAERLAAEVERLRGELERARARLIEQAPLVALGQLVAGVAHELKNPANFVYGGSMALVEQLEAGWPGPEDELKRKVLRLAGIIRTGGERIRELTDTLNTFRGQGGSARRELSVAEVVASTLALLEPLVRRRQISVSVDIPAELRFTGHRGEVYQVLTNVLLNAIQASPQAGRIEVRARRSPTGVGLEVIDQGPGIAPENLEQVFEPFFTTRASEGGTGLGLYISRSIMERQGGRIEVTRADSRGTILSISFPAGPSDGEVASDE